jgi:tryptophan halogenase
MSKRINKIVVVGGGSAGWMTASTIIKQFPNMDVSVVESPNVPTVGVGESTIGGINNWMNLIGVVDTDFMKETDASYKLSIRFTDFYRKGSGSFHYPFGVPNLEGNLEGKNDWYYKKHIYPDTPNSDYAECMYSNMALVEANKIPTDDRLEGFVFGRDTAYHFDATKYGAWLRDKICIPNGVKHISAEVTKVNTNQSDGIESLVLDNGELITADLFIDCTGFKSLLLADALNEPFTSYSDILPNNSAWATRPQYTNKEEQLNTYTDCHAIGNGWVWTIPLWSRIGTGYVYSDKYISDEGALQEFKEHLTSKGFDAENLEYKNIKMRVGIHERVWVKNVAAIGLSAGFIEPLESNGLFTVHEFVTKLCRTINRDQYVSQTDIDAYNSACKQQFKSFAEFVAMHYAFSHRDDTEYWRDVGRRTYNINKDSMFNVVDQERFFGHYYTNDYAGLHCILTGLGVYAQDTQSIISRNFPQKANWKGFFDQYIDKLNTKKQRWAHTVKDYPTIYNYLKNTIYKE